MKVRVLIADSSSVIRSGVRAVLHNRNGIRIVAEARDGRETVRLTRQHDPHVVMLDVTMPGVDGITASKKIIARQPHTRIIGLAMRADETILGQMFDAGASGLILKDTDAEEMILAVKTVMAGKSYIGKSTGQSVANSLVKNRPKSVERRRLRYLTERERQVYDLGERGFCAKEIAASLSMNVRTVETHRRQIRTKLGRLKGTTLSDVA